MASSWVPFNSCYINDLREKPSRRRQNKALPAAGGFDAEAGTAAGAGKFQYGITEDGLRALINQAVQHGHSRLNTNDRPGVIYEYDFQRQIGTNIDGQPATRLRVVVNNRNRVVTAFPF